MANAVATLKETAYPTGRDNTQRRLCSYGTCTLSAGGTYVTNGIPIGQQSGANAGAWQFSGPYGGSELINQNPIPLPASVTFVSQTGFNAAGTAYTYNYDYVHFTMRISLGGNELTNGAAISTDTILYSAEFTRF